MNKSGGRRRSGKRKDTSVSDQNRPMRLFKQLQARELIYTRKMGSTEFTVSTNVSGVLALTTLASSVNANTSAPDFASVGGIYQVWRCRSMVLVLNPFYPVNTTGVTVPAQIYVAPFFGGASLNSIQGHIDGSGCRIVSGYKPLKIAIDYKGDLDSHLWTPTSAAIAGAEAFGITCIGMNVASSVSTPVWRGVVYYICEFKMTG